MPLSFVPLVVDRSQISAKRFPSGPHFHIRVMWLRLDEEGDSIGEERKGGRERVRERERERERERMRERERETERETEREREREGENKVCGSL